MHYRIQLHAYLATKTRTFFALAKPKGRPKKLLKCSKHVNSIILRKQVGVLYKKAIRKYFVRQISGTLSIRELVTSCSYVGNFESCINMSMLSNGSIAKLK